MMTHPAAQSARNQCQKIFLITDAMMSQPAAQSAKNQCQKIFPITDAMMNQPAAQFVRNQCQKIFPITNIGMKLIVMYFAMNLVLRKDVLMRIRNGVMKHVSASALILQEMRVLDPTKYSMKKLATVIVLMILWNVPLTKNSNMTLVRVVAA
jgi:hypothetical protein